MRRSNSSAFSLIEVAVAIAIVAILAGAVAPLALKALNQQREQKTRENLKTAFEAMFGSRDHRVANMRADFGFNPSATLLDLRQMTTQPAGLRAWSPDAANGGLSWGWNGPYWTGSTLPAAGTQGLPLDGWGRPFRLNYAAAGQTWQLQSAGPNGVFGGAVNDDIFYPTVPAPRNTYQCTLTVNVNRTNPASATNLLAINIAVTHRLSAALAAVPYIGPALPYDMAKMGMQSWTYNPVVPGSIHVTVNGNDQVIDLMPGELRTLTFQFD